MRSVSLLRVGAHNKTRFCAKMRLTTKHTHLGLREVNTQKKIHCQPSINPKSSQTSTQKRKIHGALPNLVYFIGSGQTIKQYSTHKLNQHPSSFQNPKSKIISEPSQLRVSPLHLSNENLFSLIEKNEVVHPFSELNTSSLKNRLTPPKTIFGVFARESEEDLLGFLSVALRSDNPKSMKVLDFKIPFNMLNNCLFKKGDLE